MQEVLRYLRAEAQIITGKGSTHLLARSQGKGQHMCKIEGSTRVRSQVRVNTLRVNTQDQLDVRSQGKGEYTCTLRVNTHARLKDPMTALLNQRLQHFVVQSELVSSQEIGLKIIH